MQRMLYFEMCKVLVIVLYINCHVGPVFLQVNVTNDALI